MSIGDKQVTFHWKNYTRPTPANLERFAGAIRDTLAGVTGMSVYSQWPDWLTFSLAISIIVIGQAVKFFASVREEEQKQTP